MGNPKRGYFTIAQNNSQTDYVRMAYALALSIIATQSTVKSMSIGVKNEKQVSEKYRKVFEHIVEIPWADDAGNEEWKIHNEWKSFWMSPYDQTIKLDADMLFMSDYSHWWNILPQKHFWPTSNVITYRGDIITSDYYRKEVTSNKIPNVYTGCMYFDKSKESKEIFYMAGSIYRDWKVFFERFLDQNRPTWVSTDVVFSLAIDLLDYKDQCIDNNILVPTFCHMKPYIQKTRKTLSNWQNELGIFFTPDLELFIGNFKQMYPFHYQNKDFLTNQIIQYYEKKLGI